MTEADIESLEEDSVVDLEFGLMGGVGSSDIPDHLKELAYKYKVNKMICRGCYARLPINAHNCRKRKCGHCANIMNPVLTDVGMAEVNAFWTQDFAAHQ